MYGEIERKDARSPLFPTDFCATKPMRDHVNGVGGVGEIDRRKNKYKKMWLTPIAK